jgi:hypothetical protein
MNNAPIAANFSAPNRLARLRSFQLLADVISVCCAEKHVEMDEVVPLPSQSAIRMGPFYCYFLLPKREEKKEPVREKESQREKERDRGDIELKGVEGVDEGVKKPRISYNFKKICEQVRFHPHVYACKPLIPSRSAYVCVTCRLLKPSCQIG